MENKTVETTARSSSVSGGSVLLTDLGQHYLAREVRQGPSQMCSSIFERCLVRQNNSLHASLLGQLASLVGGQV
jgi:hypothetical protein